MILAGSLCSLCRVAPVIKQQDRGERTSISESSPGIPTFAFKAAYALTALHR